jgi:uncharacterized membrane protein
MATVTNLREIVSPMPGTASEYITMLAHYYRAEIARMAGWRDRIDRTTNWAITAVGAMLSVALTAPNAHHGIVLLAMVLVTLLLVIESRRYRFFDVYRTRVRRIERNWFASVFLAEPQIDREWLEELGRDLQRPVFAIGLLDAMSRRLRRNYGWMYLILLQAWLFKVAMTNAPLGAEQGSFARWVASAAAGPLPGWAVAAAVVAFHGWLIHLARRPQPKGGELLFGSVHV